MDKRQSIAESAVQASEQLFPEQRLRAQWDSVAAGCYEASAAYLAVTGEGGPAGGGVGTPSPGTQSSPGSPRPATSFDAVLRQLQAASQAVDRFYDRHRTHLEHAVASIAATPGIASGAASAANAVRLRMRGVEPRLCEYPSVRAAGQELDRAVATLDAALAAGSAAPIRTASDDVRSAAAELEAALTAAPGKETSARQSLASVSTRISGVRTRAERLAPAYSALLREFNAASSADLHENGSASGRFIDMAEADLTAAKQALADHEPERALDLTAAVRAHLTDAEELVDAVTDRLDLLRSVRTDPKAKENEVRFKLRDAQMLAVSRGVVKDWASVLDAQVERIDRVAGQLEGRNPDYWGYVSGLDAVASFISGVVQRMRTQSSDPQGAGPR